MRSLRQRFVGTRARAARVPTVGERIAAGSPPLPGDVDGVAATSGTTSGTGRGTSADGLDAGADPLAVARLWERATIPADVMAAWCRPLGPFGLFNLAMHAIVVLIVCLNGGGPLVVVVGAAMAGGFAIVGPLRMRHLPEIVFAAYLCALGVGYAYLCYVNSVASLLFFCLYPQGWFLFRARWAGVVASVWISAVAWLGMATPFGLVSSESASIGLQMAFSCAISIVAGLWVTTAQDALLARYALVAQLRDAQEEIVRVHAEQGARAERERLSREIHDTLAQGFTSVMMLARAARAEVATGDRDSANERLALIESAAAAGLAEARALVAATAPPSLAQSGLAEALRRLTRDAASAAGFAATCTVPDDVPVGVREQVVLLRAAGEALTNARRHARAREVDVTIECTAGEVLLLVRDDGRGRGDAAEGFGLAGMRARVAELAGRLEIGPRADGTGTEVCVRLPLYGTEAPA